MTPNRGRTSNKSYCAITNLSAFTELGQFYNREPGRGVAFLIGNFVAVLSATIIIGIIPYPIAWIVAIYDAYATAA